MAIKPNVYKTFNLSTDKLENLVSIKNIVGLDITLPSLSAVDSVIDEQITTKPTEIYNVAVDDSLSAVYNSVKWFFYKKSGSAKIDAISNSAQPSPVSADNIKVISIPRETMMQRISPNTLQITLSINNTEQNYYIKDEPVASTSGDSLFRGNLKISNTPDFNISDSLTSVGDIFYNYGTMVFRGNICNDASLSAFVSATNMQFNSVSTNNNIDVKTVLFKREQVKTKKIFYCRLFNNEFNFSNNPTFANADGSIKQDILDLGGMTFITTVGLYDDNNNLLAVAKVNPVEKKTAEDEMIYKVAITY